jgi:exopolysaccharide biosynthesis protein
VKHVKCVLIDMPSTFLLICLSISISLLQQQLIVVAVQNVHIDEDHQESHYVIIPSDNVDDDDDDDIFSLKVSKLTLRPRHDHISQLLNGFLAVVEGAANNFRVIVRNSQCSLYKTSFFAKEKRCAYAVNGGPFQSYLTGGCIGLVISEGKIIYSPSNSNLQGSDNNVGFGLSYDNKWILGDIRTGIKNSNDTISRGNVQIVDNQNNLIHVKEYVTGLFGWLIMDNKIIPSSISQNPENDVYAPRTAIGVNSVGNLLILQVDGCEKCIQSKGLTLHEMAKVMASPEINATYAINLDGGGSSTSVLDGKIINHPTCLDYVGWQCERQVASAICIEDKNTDDDNLQVITNE